MFKRSRRVVVRWLGGPRRTGIEDDGNYHSDAVVEVNRDGLRTDSSQPSKQRGHPPQAESCDAKWKGRKRQRGRLAERCMRVGSRRGLSCVSSGPALRVLKMWFSCPQVQGQHVLAVHAPTK